MKTKKPDTTESGQPKKLQPAPVRTQRRPLVAVASLLLVILGAVGAAWAFLSVGNTVDALAARVAIQRGQQLSADQFVTVRINPDPQLQYLSPEALDELDGQRAAHDIAAGTLVGPGASSSAAIPAAGRTVIGMSLPPGAEPGIALMAGDRVRVILTEPVYQCAGGAPQAEEGQPAAGVGECTEGQHVIDGEVVDWRRDDASGQVMASVSVAEADAATAAAAAAMERVAIVLDTRER